MVLAGGAAVDITVLAVAVATMVLVMEALSMGLRLPMVLGSMVHRRAMVAGEEADTIIVSLAVEIIVKVTLSLESQAVRQTTVMDKAKHSRRSLGLTSVNSTVARTTTATTAMEAPKPSVTMYGYAIEQLMFFELPTGGTYNLKVDNVKLVKVTVEGDPMSIPEIADCLRRIVPVENFQWEIYNFQNNVFRVKFPNKVEAQRMKTFRTYPVLDRASDLIFEDWSALEDPLYMLPEVWLRMRGIPADVRTDFLSLWAVGTLFGKTKEVDMVHTRKHKELRLRIGCLDHTLIPETTDVFIQRGFFKLAFDVEPVTVTQLGNDGIDDIRGNNGGGDDNGSNGDSRDAANDMDIEKTRNNENQNNGNKSNGNVQHVNNGKGVVGHQVQDQVKVPILLGSLNTELLSEDEDNAGTPSQDDSAPGLVKTQPESALGSVRPVDTVSPLPLGSLRPAGASLLAEPSPGAASPLPRAPRSPWSPGRPQLSTLLASTTLPLASMAPAGEMRVASASHCGTNQKHAPVSHLLSPLAPTAAGPGIDAGQSTSLV
ncbi:hypothetical protein ACQ4PT_039945 [Festuca glaucescens]